MFYLLGFCNLVWKYNFSGFIFWLFDDILSFCLDLLVFLEVDSGRLTLRKHKHFFPSFYYFSAFYCEPGVCFGVWFCGRFRDCLFYYFN